MIAALWWLTAFSADRFRVRVISWPTYFADLLVELTMTAQQ